VLWPHEALSNFRIAGARPRLCGFIIRNIAAGKIVGGLSGIIVGVTVRVSIRASNSASHVGRKRILGRAASPGEGPLSGVKRK
jgi:hypothetical protein